MWAVSANILLVGSAHVSDLRDDAHVSPFKTRSQEFRAFVTLIL